MGKAQEWQGKVLHDTYRIERLLGEGGMGAVYEAAHLRLRRHFAVKLLFPEVASRPEAVARFRREAEITSEMGHPHIVDVIDFNHAPDGSPYIVMELLEGEDLANRLLRERRLELPQAGWILSQTASALQAAHEKGIIHRDLKPQNIFLCTRGKRNDFVKVLDFGISKVLGSHSVLTKTQAVMGTPCYMSPEQAEGRSAEVDARSDMFTMGIILYQMLTGELPFFDEYIPTLLYKIVHHEMPSLRALRSDVPEEVERVVRRALAKQPQERYGSMAELTREFSKSVALHLRMPHLFTEDREEDWTEPATLDDATAATSPPATGAETPATDPALPSAFVKQPTTPGVGPYAPVSADVKTQERPDALPATEDAPVTDEKLNLGLMNQPSTLSESVGELQPALAPSATELRRELMPRWGPRVLVAVAGLALAGVVVYLITEESGPTRSPTGQPAAALSPPDQRPARVKTTSPGPKDAAAPGTARIAARQPAAGKPKPAPAKVGPPKPKPTPAATRPRASAAPRKGRPTATARPGTATLARPTVPARADGPAVAAAKPKPDPKPRLCKLRVFAKPVWGHVYLDGKRVGPSPIILDDVKPGTHMVEVRRKGFRALPTRIILRPGQVETVVIEFER